MKTVEQIKAKIKEGFPTDPFGFGASDLIYALPFGCAKEYLNEEFLVTADAEDVYNDKYYIGSEEKVLQQIRDYVDFAQGKIDDQRGLSADRSCQHFIAWFWLIDEVFSDELARTYHSNYYPYGQPVLDKVIAYLKVKED